MRKKYHDMLLYIPSNITEKTSQLISPSVIIYWVFLQYWIYLHKYPNNGCWFNLHLTSDFSTSPQAIGNVRPPDRAQRVPLPQKPVMAWKGVPQVPHRKPQICSRRPGLVNIQNL